MIIYGTKITHYSPLDQAWQGQTINYEIHKTVLQSRLTRACGAREVDK